MKRHHFATLMGSWFHREVGIRLKECKECDVSPTYNPCISLMHSLSSGYLPWTQTVLDHESLATVLLLLHTCQCSKCYMMPSYVLELFPPPAKNWYKTQYMGTSGVLRTFIRVCLHKLHDIHSLLSMLVDCKQPPSTCYLPKPSYDVYVCMRMCLCRFIELLLYR